MTEFNVSFPDFSNGELSPRMYGRHDLSAYYKGARRIENFVSQTVGPAHYREGFIFASPSRDNAVAYLFTFEITETVSFTLEFTSGFIRFYRNNGQVRYTSQGITGITKANPAVVTYVGADTYSNGDRVYIDDIVGMTELNGSEYVVANVNTGANTFELAGVNSTGYTTYSSGGTVAEVVEVATPYTLSDLFELKFASQSNSLYIAHPLHPPQKLVYTSPTSWALTPHAPIQSSFSVSQTLTAITKANPAVVTYTGSDNFSNGDRVRITGVSGMTEVNDEDYVVANVNTGVNTFELQGTDSSGFGTYSSGGIVRKYIDAPAVFLSASEYPAAVGFYEQRLVYGGSSNRPNTLFFSRPALPDDFTKGTEVDQGIEYTIAGNANKILWLRGTSRFLAVGALGDVYQVTGGIDNVVTPSSISIRPSNSFGVANINPIGRGSQIFFPQSNNLIIRSFEYDLQQDSYVPIDRNIIADHITISGITQIAYQEGRPNLLWAIRNDGILAGMTQEETEGISGWHRHNTDGKFISITGLSRTGQYDQLWACVERVIDGVTKRYIEYMADEVIFPAREDYITDDEEADLSVYNNLMFEKQKEYIHLDSALSYYGNQNSVTMTPSAVTGSSVTFTASGAIFDADMVGRQIWRKSVTGLETGRAEIISYTSSTVVTCQILEDFDSTTVIPAEEWYLTTDTVIGLQHLEGKSLNICADGGQHSAVEVTNGVIMLDRQCSVVHAGIGYTGYLETNDLEGGGTNGVAQTKKKSVNAVGFRFLNTLYAEFGTNYYKLDTVEMRTASMRMDRPPQMFTGDEKLTYVNNALDDRGGGWQRSKRAIIAQRNPYPCNVQLIIPYMSVSN